MDDRSIIEDIGQLVEEEKQLRARHTATEGLGDEDRARLQHVEERLDQCWDLLRQRDAHRPSAAAPPAAGGRGLRPGPGQGPGAPRVRGRGLSAVAGVHRTRPDPTRHDEDP